LSVSGRKGSGLNGNPIGTAECGPNFDISWHTA
jgi:hypothetical protein